MELIDKQKLLEWLESEFYVGDEGYRAGIKWVAYNLEKGTFDAHSAQEREPTVAQLKQYIECRADRDEWKARAIQAEQERDELKRVRESCVCLLPSEFEQMDRERNALLEGLKVVFRIASDKSTTPRSDRLEAFEGYVRSIIAKLEPEGNPNE